MFRLAPTVRFGMIAFFITVLYISAVIFVAGMIKPYLFKHIGLTRRKHIFTFCNILSIISIIGVFAVLEVQSYKTPIYSPLPPDNDLLSEQTLQTEYIPTHDPPSPSLHQEQIQILELEYQYPGK